MLDKIFPSLSKEQWLALRQEDITSTEIAALYGLSPYETEYSLYHKKCGAFSDELESSERLLLGLTLQQGIADTIANLYGVNLNKMPDYMRHQSVEKMGSSFDFQIIGINEPKTQKYSHLQDKFNKFGPGILEIKKVDQDIFKKKWGNDEVPIHIEFQLQHQLEVSNFSWGAIGVLVGGNEIEIYIRDRDTIVGNKICEKINHFWKQVNSNIEPNYDSNRDYHIINKLFTSNSTGEILNLSEEADFEKACERFDAIKEEQRKLSNEEKEIKAMLLKRIEGCCGANTKNHFIKITPVKEILPTVITSEMIGQTYGGRAGYNLMTIKELK